jgi:hypothetical protein
LLLWLVSKGAHSINRLTSECGTELYLEIRLVGLTLRREYLREYKSMPEAHRHMRLKEEHFNAVAENLVKTLEKLNVLSSVYVSSSPFLS